MKSQWNHPRNVPVSQQQRFIVDQFPGRMEAVSSWFSDFLCRKVLTFFLAELWKNGYPLYSLFLSSQTGLQNFRRFRTLRMRMLLLKQDRISRLEEQLNEIDRSEPAVLFLGNCRRDKNEHRESVLKKLDDAFSDYGRCIA